MGGNTGGWLCSSSPEQVKTPWIQTFDPLSSGETRGWFSHFPSLEQVPHVSPFFVAHRFTSNDICPICTPVIGDIRDLTRSNIVLRHATVEWGNAVGGSTLFTLSRWLSHQTGVPYLWTCSNIQWSTNPRWKRTVGGSALFHLSRCLLRLLLAAASFFFGAAAPYTRCLYSLRVSCHQQLDPR
jgi:hypothetical protein